MKKHYNLMSMVRIGDFRFHKNLGAGKYLVKCVHCKEITERTNYLFRTRKNNRCKNKDCIKAKRKKYLKEYYAKQFYESR